jgi:AcrR family transcriptional regulator
MTQIVKLVSTMKWDYQQIEAMLEQFSKGSDPDDPKARKRKRIVESATEVFIQHGYRKASMDDVAERAGVAKGTIYLYFKNKAELLLEATIEEKKRYFAKLKSIFQPDVEGSERLRRYLRAAFLLAKELPMISRLMSGDREMLAALAEMDDYVQRAAAQLPVEILSAMLDEAAAPHRWTPEELEDRARVLLGLVHSAGAFGDERIRQGLDFERFAGILADMIVDGVRGGRS